MENISLKKQLLLNEQNFAIEMKARLERRKAYQKNSQPRRIIKENAEPIRYYRSLEDKRFQSAYHQVRSI